MHREYLREVHPVRLNTLILTGELWTYLADLNEQAQERLDTIMEQMKIAEGVTEELKCTRQMEWVWRCNNIHNRAENSISIFAISTYNTDYVLIKKENYQKALDILKDSGYEIVE